MSVGDGASRPLHPGPGFFEERARQDQSFVSRALGQVDPHQGRGRLGAGPGQDRGDHGVTAQVRVSFLGQLRCHARQAGTRLEDRHGHGRRR